MELRVLAEKVEDPALAVSAAAAAAASASASSSTSSTSTHGRSSGSDTYASTCSALIHRAYSATVSGFVPSGPATKTPSSLAFRAFVSNAMGSRGDSTTHVGRTPKYARPPFG